jgi:hypothetical protein
MCVTFTIEPNKKSKIPPFCFHSIKHVTCVSRDHRRGLQRKGEKINCEAPAEERAREGKSSEEAGKISPTPVDGILPHQSSLKTLEQPAMAGKAPEPAAALPHPGYFTAADVEVADVLVFLQDSSTSTGGKGYPTAGEGSYVALAASGSSSPHSVNAAPAPAPAPAPARQPTLTRGVGARLDAEEEDEQEVHGSPRRIKRSRPIAKIYRATQRIGRRSVKNN